MVFRTYFATLDLDANFPIIFADLFDLNILVQFMFLFNFIVFKESFSLPCTCFLCETKVNEYAIIMLFCVVARYDWYQTETQVIIMVLIKNLEKEEVKADFGEKTVRSVTLIFWFL